MFTASASCASREVAWTTNDTHNGNESRTLTVAFVVVVSFVRCARNLRSTEQASGDLLLL